jgi:hypothetical protein
MAQLYAVPCCLYFNSIKYYWQLFNVILRMVAQCQAVGIYIGGNIGTIAAIISAKGPTYREVVFNYI